MIDLKSTDSETDEAFIPYARLAAAVVARAIDEARQPTAEIVEAFGKTAKRVKSDAKTQRRVERLARAAVEWIYSPGLFDVWCYAAGTDPAKVRIALIDDSTVDDDRFGELSRFAIRQRMMSLGIKEPER